MLRIFLRPILSFGTGLMLASTLAAAPPNIVLIFVDDMGYNDIGAYAYPWSNPYPGSGPFPISYSSAYNPLPAPNQAFGLTPRIDSLASDGMQFTSFYAASASCTPSRAGLLTGCYPTRVDLEEVIWQSSQTFGLNPSEVTLPERLKQRGYATALIGKWHLGTFGGSFGMDFHPIRHGFDRFFGLPGSNDLFVTTLWDDESEVTTPYVTATGGSLISPVNSISDQRYLLEALTEQALDFIDTAHTSGDPFFLYFASHVPHVPCWPHPDFAGVSGTSQYYDVVAELDHRVGVLLDRLDSLGIADNTLVIFTADNGPWVTRPNPGRPEQSVGSAYPLRGYKRMAGEGGPRVPFLARLTGRIPAGTVADGLGSNIDLLPTLLNLAGGEVPVDRPIDGIDLWPLLSGQTLESPRDVFYYYEQNDTSAVGVRQGDLKLLTQSDFGSPWGMFDLSTDIQESVNLGTSSTLSNLINTHNSAMVRRTRATGKSNWIEVDTSTVTVVEEGTAGFRVRLHAPANITLSVSRFSGDADLSVESGGTLTFSNGNYNQWQTVTLTAGPDSDLENGGATFRTSGGNLHLREVFALESDTGSNEPPLPPVPELPASLNGLVGWFDAQQLTGVDGTEVIVWPDETGGTNTIPNNLVQVSSSWQAALTAAAPTLQSVSLNGLDFRSVRFAAGTTNQFELLKAADLVVDGDTNRTMMVVYKGGMDFANSRAAGFGSSMEENINGDRRVWNLGCDGNGTSRFDGAAISSGYSAGLNRSDVLIRTAVMESPTQFDEYIDVLDADFIDNQVLSNGTPSKGLGSIRGHFYLGDIQQSAYGGGEGDSALDILEVLVYDRVLSAQERQDVQAYLVFKYTTDPYPVDVTDVSVVTVDESAYLALTYRRIAGGTGTTGVDYTALGRTYTVEYDTDLTAPWNSGSVVQVGEAIDNDDGTETVTVRLTTPLAEDGRQFMRLRVSM